MKRLAASVAVAGRDRGFEDAVSSSIVWATALKEAAASGRIVAETEL